MESFNKYLRTSGICFAGAVDLLRFCGTIALPTYDKVGEAEFKGKQWVGEKFAGLRVEMSRGIPTLFCENWEVGRRGGWPHLFLLIGIL